MNIFDKLKQRKQEELQAMAREAIDVTYKDGDIWLVVDNIPIYRVMSSRAGEVIDCPIEQLPRQIERLRISSCKWKQGLRRWDYEIGD